jgi:hypothetical protein
VVAEEEEEPDNEEEESSSDGVDIGGGEVVSVEPEVGRNNDADIGRLRKRRRRPGGAGDGRGVRSERAKTCQYQKRGRGARLQEQERLTRFARRSLEHSLGASFRLFGYIIPIPITSTRYSYVGIPVLSCSFLLPPFSLPLRNETQKQNWADIPLTDYRYLKFAPPPTPTHLKSRSSKAGKEGRKLGRRALFGDHVLRHILARSPIPKRENFSSLMPD